MKILIHACPQRMWYVRDFLIPMLQEQGAEHIEVWNDVKQQGNLVACMRSFASRQGTGDEGTWHIQDDVLPCRDFVKRCEENDEGLVYGFCCRNFGDRLDAHGEVFVVDAWNSFQCVRIPDAWARDCAKWVFSKDWQKESPLPELQIMFGVGRGDDTFYHEYMNCRHPYETALNLKPNLVEHVDWLLGGSSLQKWRDYIARAEYFEDQDLIDELRDRIKRYNSDDHI